jgi:hypothetical protein
MDKVMEDASIRENCVKYLSERAKKEEVKKALESLASLAIRFPDGFEDKLNEWVKSSVERIKRFARFGQKQSDKQATFNNALFQTVSSFQNSYWKKLSEV